ncbi:MAG: aminoacyl-tRNA hydrolase [Rhodospirillaceae bacterium]|nr:aminoacyl-tRNA hydrolase [Rhodospirillaceae bacterium]|tara:strand:- start:5614 stop:6222 length:609 start_codon:yes stop_codon:yes gene_type:complete
MQLVVGLGNPGERYASNRHNIGFMAVDEIVRQHNLPNFQKKTRLQSNFSEGLIGSRKIVVIKPMNFMNGSGKPVGDTMRYFRLTPSDIFVFHDEIDIPAGCLRVKKGGGHAGHNGIKDIENHIGREFWRVRLGVGRPRSKERVIGHVLGNFSKIDHAWLFPVLDATANKLPILLDGSAAEYIKLVAIKLSDINFKEEEEEEK